MQTEIMTFIAGRVDTFVDDLEALHHNDVLDQLSIGVCFNGDEEVGSGSSRPWIEAHACNSQRVFVFEPCRPGHRFVLQ